MARRIPPAPKPPVLAANSAPPGFKRKSLQIEVVTPIYGGGVEPGKHDPTMPIRATSIRGHLRFWWRLACGTGLSPDALRKREQEVWGSAENTSPVTVRIDQFSNDNELCRKRNQGDRKEFGFDRFGAEAYALFPAIENKVDAILDKGLTFQVTITWPSVSRLKKIRAAENFQRTKEQKSLGSDDISDDINRAITLWLHFGGIGSRIRRGLGALWCRDAQVGSNWKSLLPAGTRVFVGPSCVPNAMRAWSDAVGVYKLFRQSYRGQDRGGNARRGRSKWPEPDSLRDVSNCQLPRHSTAVVDDAVIRSFPRAVLGLPIVFHFGKDGPLKDERNNPGPAAADSNRDPADIMLLPDRGVDAEGNPKSQRMASPVITRPLRMNNAWYPAVIILPHDHALKIDARLHGSGAKWDSKKKKAVDLNEDIPSSQIVGSHLIGLDPLKPGCENAIDGLIQFLGAATDGSGNRKIPFTEVQT